MTWKLRSLESIERMTHTLGNVSLDPRRNREICHIYWGASLSFRLWIIRGEITRRNSSTHSCSTQSRKCIVQRMANAIEEKGGEKRTHWGSMTQFLGDLFFYDSRPKEFLHSQWSEFQISKEADERESLLIWFNAKRIASFHPHRWWLE
jgi:hypothetical protein